MPKRTKGEQRSANTSTVQWITLGTVVDTNDPQQMGRLRVLCPALGDRIETLISNLPWCSYVSPFGGVLTRGNKGPEELGSDGPTAYGMWTIPKVGALVLVMCLDGNPEYRIWLGCLYGQFLPHTLPMGRWLDDQERGPLSSTEGAIDPMATNAIEAFNAETDSPEWKTRIAEKQVAGVRGQVLNEVVSREADERDDESLRTGYQRNRQRPDLASPSQGKTGGANLDSQIYSITSPGLHTFMMDDAVANGRIRIKTTSGNQIIMDDTNERLYISTPDGENYIEMDRKGNIDIYSTRRISIHAEKDINFTTEGAFRVSAESIHLRAKEDIRMHADENIDIRADDDIRITTTGITSHLDIDIGGHVYMTSGIGMDIALDAGAGGNIELNSGVAMPDSADYAFTTSRVPIHEPWGRISNNPGKTDNVGSSNDVNLVLNMTKDSDTLELSYTSDNANFVDLGDNLGRNDNWRR